MKRQLAATIDCGSSSARCLIFDMDTGEQVALGSQDWYAARSSHIPGAFDFDAGNNWPVVCRCIKKALEGLSKTGDSPDIKAVSGTGFRHGFLCLDKKGSEIFGCFNMDTRADQQVSRLNESGLSEQIFNLTGDWPGVHALPRLIWLKEKDPETYGLIHRIILPSDWAVFRLCGEAAAEPGDASSTLVFDLAERAWSARIMKMCGLREDIYPRIVDPGTVIGKISAAAARETGLKEGIPVTVGVADTQAGLVGIGCKGPGAAAVVAGTWWMDCAIAEEPFIDPKMRLRNSCHSEPGTWVFEGVGALVGAATRWFRDVFCREEVRQGEEQRVDPYVLLDRQSLDVPPGSRGIQILFANLTTQRYWKMGPAGFLGWDILNPAQSHKGVFFKAIMENAAMQTYGEFKTIEDVSGRFPPKLIMAGGAAKSRVWPQILSDVRQRPVQIPRITEGTSIGTAIYAAVGAGIYKSASEAAGRLI
ncbi:MAG: hypothetical protein LBQ61_07300, partial [Spirochaetales bacterium]|nr:hypothetical protein [Spirochaetales bacterium]